MIRLTLADPSNSDFTIFYFTARLVADGLPMYGVSPARYGIEWAADHLGNLNPPHFQILALPLGHMSYGAALGVWVAREPGLRDRVGRADRAGARGAVLVAAPLAVGSVHDLLGRLHHRCGDVRADLRADAAVHARLACLAQRPLDVGRRVAWRVRELQAVPPARRALAGVAAAMEGAGRVPGGRRSAGGCRRPRVWCRVLPAVDRHARTRGLVVAAR